MKHSDPHIPIKLIVKNGEKTLVLKINTSQGIKSNLEKKEEFTNKEMNKRTPTKLNIPIKKNTDSPKIQLKLKKCNINFIDSPQSPLVPPSDEIDDSVFDESIQNNQVENCENVERNVKSDNEIKNETNEVNEVKGNDEFGEFGDEIKEIIDEIKGNDEVNETNNENDEIEVIKEIVTIQPPKREFKIQPPVSSINNPKTPTESKPKSFPRSKPVSHSHSIGSEMNIKTYRKEGPKKSNKFDQNKKKIKNAPRSSRSSHSSGSEPDFKSKFSIELPEISFNSLQVRKYCEQAYSNDDFSALYNLIEIFDAIRRILMKIKKAVPLRDAELDVINSISIIQVSQDEINDCLTFTIINLPAENFEPEAWLKVYKEMLPEHGIFNTFNLDSFNALHKIFTRIRLTEASFGREKIMEKVMEDIEEEKNEIKCSSMSSKEKQMKLRELESKIYEMQQEGYHKAQDKAAYEIADSMKEYIENHLDSIDDFNDTYITLIWRIITGDILIFISPLMNQIINTFQIDTKMFSSRIPIIRNVANNTKYTQINIEEYSTKCRSIRDNFFIVHKGLTRETTTKKEWDEWRDYYLLFNSLILNLDYKLSQMLGEDISDLDSGLIKTIRNVQKHEFISFKDYDNNNGKKWSSVYNPYNDLDLTDYNTATPIKKLLNRVNNKNLQESKYYLRMYPTEGVIRTFFNNINTYASFQMAFTKIFSELDGHREVIEKYVIDTITKKDITESFWRIFIALVAEDLIDSSVIDKIINDFLTYKYDIRISLIEAINYMIKTYPNELTKAIPFFKIIVELLENSLDANESSGYKTIGFTKCIISDIKEFIGKH